jgi:hypothetical protein
MNKVRKNPRGVSVLVVLSVLTSINQANAAGKIYYGSRAGMQVTVVSMEGLDSSNAVIRTRHTREDATAFCSEYVGKVTEECIKSELETRMNDQVVADCLGGVFTNFWGDRIQFRGPNRKKGEFGPKYILVNMRSGEIADGSSASNYPTNMGIFQALCPKIAPYEP